MENTKKITNVIAEVGIFAAIGWILDEIQGAWSISFTSGGSIGIAMVAVLIVAFRRGWLPAICTGLIMGLLDLATKAYIIHPAQVFLDYILPYALVGVAGLFKPLFDDIDNRNTKIWILVLATLAGGILKFMSHFLAGYIFWNDAAYFAWNLNYMNPALYSFVYNIAYIGPSILVSAIMLIVLFLKAPKVLMTQGEVVVYVDSEEHKNRTLGFVISSILMAAGTFLFIFFLIKYIQSAKIEQWGNETDYKASQDSMVIFISGLSLLILGINNLLKTIKNIFKLETVVLVFGSISIAYSMYGLAKVIKMIAENALENEPLKNYYWAWFIPAFVVGLTLFLIALHTIRKKKQKN